MRRVAVSFAVAACWVLCSLAPAEAKDSLPENGKIAFTGTGDRGVTYDIYTVEPDGSNLSPLTDTTDQYEERPIWSPDGTDIAFSVAVGEGEAHIPVMGADGSYLRELPTDPNRSGSIST
jgi:Tol biopolymer transport system component